MLEKILFLFVLFLPFQFALHPVESVDLALPRVVAILLFFWWVARNLFHKRLILPRPAPFFFFAAFLLWVGLSFLWAENFLWALRKAAFLFSFLPLFLVFFAAAQDAALRKKMFQGLVLGAGAAAFLALIQFFSQFIFGVSQVFSFWVSSLLPFFLGPSFGGAVASYPSLLVNLSGVTVMRASLFFPDPHMFAFFLGMSFPLALSFALDKNSQKRFWWVACAACILVADFLTFSRGGYVGLIFGMGAFSFPFVLRSPWWKKHWFRASMLGIIVLVGILASPVGTRLSSSFSQDDGSNVERLRLWQEALGNIAARPWLGTGLGNYPLLVKPTADYREPIYAHNLFLDIALETGLVGLFFFISLLLLGVFSAWKKWKKDQDVLMLAVCASLIIFSVHSLFETPLFSVHVLPVFLFLLSASLV